MPAADPRAFTLATGRGRRLCKTRHADGWADDYSAARIFDLAAMQAHDLAALAVLLCDLAGRRDTCVLRGLPSVVSEADLPRVFDAIVRDLRRGRA